ncbi:MAG: hypothetical protein KDD42_07840, partial [Bdellovibrionales bacterium]|nr:hypothetical protein [Bdellovibrionales bacterium]
MADKVFELIDPESSSSSDNRAAKDAELWLRITAFLSVKSPSTQVTYAGIIRDWCGFLGATAGS